MPQQELEVLRTKYSFDEKQCTGTAEAAVDMQRQCSEAHWADCVSAGTMYWRGCGVAVDLVQAEALYQRACGFGSMLGCALAGVIMKGVEQRVPLLEEPCARGYLYACGVLGIALFNRGKEADVPRATGLLETACNKDRVSFCGGLGAIVAKWQLEPRFAATRALLEQACKAPDADSCYMLAISLEDGALGTVDDDRAATLNSTTCHDLGHLASCNALGHRLVLGRGREQDLAKGAWYFYEACNRGYGPSCDSMGEATEKGWGGPASSSKALPFYDRGCELGSEHACQRAKELRSAGSGIADPPRD